MGLETLPHKVGSNEDIRNLSGGDCDAPIDWLCDVCGCVISPTSGIYWVDLGFINNYKESQLWLVFLRYSVDVASIFPWVVTRSLTWYGRLLSIVIFVISAKLFQNLHYMPYGLARNRNSVIVVHPPQLLHPCRPRVSWKSPPSVASKLILMVQSS